MIIWRLARPSISDEREISTLALSQSVSPSMPSSDPLSVAFSRECRAEEGEQQSLVSSSPSIHPSIPSSIGAKLRSVLHIRCVSRRRRRRRRRSICSSPVRRLRRLKSEAIRPSYFMRVQSIGGRQRCLLRIAKVGENGRLCDYLS